MFKIDKKTNKIFLTKGDSASFNIKVLRADGTERGIYDDDTLIITVRKTVDSEDISLTKTAVNGVITISPDDTKSLSVGQYRYDIQLTTFAGNVYTIIPDSSFEIGTEVSR